MRNAPRAAKSNCIILTGWGEVTLVITAVAVIQNVPLKKKFLDFRREANVSVASRGHRPNPFVEISSSSRWGASCPPFIYY